MSQDIGKCFRIGDRRSCSRLPVGFRGGNVRFFEAPVRKHAAGLLDGDPGVAPDQHIFVDYAASWDEITDARLQCTERYVTNMRKAEWKE